MALLGTDPPVLRIVASSGLRLEFERDFPWGPDDPYMTELLVHVVGDRVRIDHAAVLLGPVELPAFLRGISEDFRGWEGVRTWRSLEDELRIAATHDGHVHLCWELVRRPRADDSWTFRVTTRHDAGEEMRTLADDVEALLG